MTTEEAASAEPKRELRYAGFISYSQKDKAWARRIHRALEQYRLPSGLPEDVRKRKRLGRFFRDDDELAGAPSLGAALEGAIDDSSALIVICSPNAARSKWVDAEVRRFKSRGASDRVFAIIVGGRPDAEDPEERCFPPSLLSRVDVDGNLTGEPDEPLAPDANKESFPRLTARLVAGLLGLSFDALWQRERRRRMRRRIGASAASMLLAIGLGASYKYADNADQLRLQSESIALAVAAQTALDEGRFSDALLDLRMALPSNLDDPERPIAPEALAALRRALSDSMAEGKIAQFEDPIRAIRKTPKGLLAVFSDGGAVNVVDPENGVRQRTLPAELRYQPLGVSGFIYASNNTERQRNDGTWTIDSTASVTDPDTGDLVREVSISEGEWWLTDTLSPGGDRVLATAIGDREPTELAVFALEVNGSDYASPAAVADAPFIDVDRYLSAAFGDNDTVFMSWGEERKALAVWDISNSSPRLLVEASEDAGCNSPYATDADSRDSVSLSPDHSLVTHARPLTGDAWCVRVWDGRTGQQLSGLVLEDAAAAGVQALSKDTYALAKYWNDWSSNAELRTADGRRFKVQDCEESPFETLSLAARIDGWVTDPQAQITACASGQGIIVLGGPEYQSLGTYLGHDGRINALWLDTVKRQLWSGGEDGTLRRWTVPPATEMVVDLEPVAPAVSNGPHVASLFRDRDGRFWLQTFDSIGRTVSPRVPFVLAPVPDGQVEPKRDVAVVLLADGRTMGVAEAFDCGFLGCPKEYRNRLTLWRVKDGKLLTKVDGIAVAGFLNRVPVALHSEGTSALLRMREGMAEFVDLLTGQVKTRILPLEGSFILDAAFAHGDWWLVQANELDQVERREIKILRLSGSPEAEGVLGSQPEVVDRRRSQSANLYPAQRGGGLVISHSYTHEVLETSLISVTADGDLIAANDLPPYATSIEGITFLSASDHGKAAVFFGSAGPPLLFDLADGLLTPFATSQPGSILDTWRVDDPLGRAAVSVDGGQLSILSFGQTVSGVEPVCSALNGSAAEAAAFDREGNLLAVASSGVVTIYDLATCTAERAISIDVRGLNPLVFAEAGELWVRESAGRFRIIRPPVPDRDLLSTLHKLVTHEPR